MSRELLTPDEFRAILDRWELTIDEFSYLTGYDRKTVTGWGKVRGARGLQRFPRWVPLLLDAWDIAGGPPQEHPWDGMVDGS